MHPNQSAPSLNPQQRRAVDHLEGPLLVIAGAGSGKTRIVTFRIAKLINAGISPGAILAVTFTNKAAQEMHERVAELLKDHRGHDRPLICTFHSLGTRILRESAHHLGFQNNFVIYDEDDSDKLLKKCLQSLNVKLEESKGLRNLISHCKNQLQKPQDIAHSDLPPAFKNLFPQVYSLYQERLKEANALDFDDLLFLPVRLFQENKEILALYQKRWPFMLIDEYQDTNQAQYLLTKLIVEKSQNLFVVGDPDQSIYSWRGANIANILNFEHDYKNAQVVRLEQNYRSRKNILDAANALIENNRGRLKKELWSELGAGEKITLFVGSSERDEADFVTDEILNLHHDDKIPLNEIAIFYRTNFQSRTFEDYLLRKKIPYVIVGGISFYQRKEIKDILSYLHMLESDNDFISFARTVNLPKRGLGDASLEKIRVQASALKRPLLQFCKELVEGQGVRQENSVRLNEKQREGLKEYCAVLEDLKAIKSDSIQKLIIETVKKSRYYDILREEKETFEDRKANIEELISKGAEWDMMNEETSLSKFLEELTLKGSLDDVSLSEDRISLMTFHNGKGLEFAVTFLGGMEEDLFPHANSRGNYEAIEEERRLCYVGMTRAKERLYLTAAETRLLWGSLRTMRPSRFLKEIPREYMQRMQ